MSADKWDYRVVRELDKNGDNFFVVREVHYDADGKPSWCPDYFAFPMGETVSELANNLGILVMALGLPVLSLSDLQVEEWPSAHPGDVGEDDLDDVCADYREEKVRLN